MDKPRGGPRGLGMYNPNGGLGDVLTPMGVFLDIFNCLGFFGMHKLVLGIFCWACNPSPLNKCTGCAIGGTIFSRPGPRALIWYQNQISLVFP